MTTTHLNSLIANLRATEAMGGMPAGAMNHVQKAIERLERKVLSVERALAAEG